MASRQTRSTLKKQDSPTKKQKEVDDGLIEEGFSVVDSDNKAQKEETSKPMGDSGKEQPAVGKQQEMDTTGSGEQMEEEKKVDEGNDSVAETAAISENAADEEGKSKEESKDDGEQHVENGEPGNETAKEDTDENKKQEDEEKPAENGKEKKPRHPIVWVSNISRHVKATDLKKHFSKHGKVVTAKIVTNGRNLFGYVCLDSLEAVDVCVKNLHDSEFEGRKICVTVDKPVRDDKNSKRKEKETDVVKDPLTTKYDETEKKGDESKSGEKKKTSSSTASSKRRIDTSKMSEDELRKEIALCEREIDRLRTRLIEEQARCRGEVTRCRRLERDLSDAELKIRDDRRRYEREREEWTKKTRLDELRLDAERVIIERDREEMRRAREEFERDLRRFLDDQQRAAAMERAPRGPVSPPPPKRFRGDEPSEAKGAWINETAIAGGGQRDQSGPQSRNTPYFPGSGGSPWAGNQGPQWRASNANNSGGGPQTYFRNEQGYGRSSGGGYGGSGDGGFRSGPFETSNRKF